MTPTERELGMWQFEDGTWVKITCSAGFQNIERALDMVEKLIELRRLELQRKKEAV